MQPSSTKTRVSFATEYRSQYKPWLSPKKVKSSGDTCTNANNNNNNNNNNVEDEDTDEIKVPQQQIQDVRQSCKVGTCWYFLQLKAAQTVLSI